MYEVQMKSGFISICKLLSRYYLYCVVFAFLVLITIQCDSGNDPQDAARVLISMKDKTGQYVLENAIDSTGNVAKVRIVLHDCSDIKKLRVQILNLQDNSIEYDTVYNFVSVTAQDSLITFSRVHSTAGTKEISAVGTMGDFSTKGVSLRFTVIQKPFVNKAPEVILSGNKAISNIQSCTLTVQINDDTGQKSSAVVKYRNNEYFLNANSQFIVTPPAGYIGNDTVEVIATDNYTPPLSTKSSVIIPVNSADVSIPSKPGNLRIKTQTADIVTLIWDKTLNAVRYAVYRSAAADKDFLKLQDSVVNSEYTDSTGNRIWYYYVVAKNAAGESPASDIIASSMINRSPKWATKEITEEVAKGLIYTLRLDDNCKDPDGDSIQYLLLSGMGTITNSVFTFTASNADTALNKVKIIASDTRLSDTL